MRDFILLFVIVAFEFINGQYKITQSTINCGGVISENNSNSIVCSLGETIVGVSFSGMYQNQIGFWYPYQIKSLTDTEMEKLLPSSFILEQNYPNPFNSSTTIKYAVSENNRIAIKIYSVVGEEVMTVLDENKEVGYYQLTFQASSLASGLYLYQMRTKNFIGTRKMILLK